MILNNHLLLPEPYSTRLVSTPAHPQLRDLLVYAPEAPGSVSVVCYDSIARHALDAQAPPSYTRLRFSPSTLASGCGLIACGGQSSELALKAAEPGSTWCYQQPSQPNGSIHNSIHIAPAPTSASRVGGGAGIRLFVSSNAERIEVYDVAGPVPDYQRARRRRQKQKRPSERMELDEGSEKGEVGDEAVEEDGVHDQGGPCTLERVKMDHLAFDTAINHSSVSPDGRWLVAVGDTNEVHLLQAQSDGSFLPYHRFEASNDASFSTDWSATGDKFAVASQDGYVNIYDIRSLPPFPSSRSADASTPAPRTVASLKATQGGPAGAVRKLKFSPGSRVDSELLAFTEHRSKVHVVDARHFNEMQLLDIPSCSASSMPSPAPRARPRPPSVYSLRSRHAQPNPRAFVDSLYPPSGEVPDRSSPEERFMRRLLQDAGSTTDERSRSRGSRGWRYTSGTDGEAVEVADDDAEREDEDEDDEMDDEDELAVLEQGLSAQRTRLITEDDCPPDSSSSLALPNLNYARILPDPRARARSSTAARREVPNSSLTNLISDLPPFHFTPTSTARTPHDSPRPSRAQILSGYSPLSTSARHPDPNSGSYLDGSIVGTIPASSDNYLDTIGLSALGAGGYQPNSLYFPVESTPSDLLGLDWDEEGRSLFVATEGRVWEWEVDVRGRRSFGDWGLR